MDSRIGHHSKIGKHTLLSGVFLEGNVKIDSQLFLGLNANVKENVKVAEDNIIGMGCNIIKNTKSQEVY